MAIEATAPSPPRPPAASAEGAAVPSLEQPAWRPLASSVVLWRRRLSGALPGRPTQQCRAAAGRPRPQAAAMRKRAVQLAREDQAAEAPGGGSDGTRLAPWRGPVQPPLGLRRVGLGAPIAAARTAPWRPREWAGPPWQREGPAVRPVEVAPRWPACPRPRPSCDPVSWRAGVTAKVPPAAASTVSPYREWDGGSLPLRPSRQMLKSEPCGAAQPLGGPPLAGRPPTRSACRTPPTSPTPFGLPGTP